MSHSSIPSPDGRNSAAILRGMALLPLLAACATPDADTGTFCGAPLAELVLSETDLDFGTLAPGDSAVRTVELSNPGDGPLGVTSVAIGEGRPDFEVTV